MKNPTEEVRRICLDTLVVGYFVCAQYDVKSPIVGVADTSPEGGSKLPSLRGSETTKQTPGRVEVYGVYSPYFFRGIAAALRASQ